MRIVIPKEQHAGERRIAVSVRSIAQYVKAGHQIAIEEGAGAGSFLSDEEMREAGATILPSSSVWEGAAFVLKVRCPTVDECAVIPDGCTLVGSMEFSRSLDAISLLMSKHATVFDLDLLPRITKAQEMDALSSMSNLSGYSAVMLGATLLPKIFPLLMTAAGTVTPARVLVLGAGVAGLQAIATAKRLGAVVEAFDVRPAVKDQVESLGATFLSSELQSQASETSGGYATTLSKDQEEAEHALLAEHTALADVVITTALIPQRPAPVLITADMVKSMKPGSVIVDLAATAGGNCELTTPGSTTVEHGVTIAAPLEVASVTAINATQLYAHNIEKFALHLLKVTPDASFPSEIEDDILGPTCLLRQGESAAAALRSKLEEARA